MKKLDKKGFTLTELLAVILIISLLVGLSTTVFISIRNNTLEKDYENLVTYLETKAAEYANKTGIITVSVEDLIKEGVIKADDGSDIYDPRDNSSLNCYIITSTYKDGGYTSVFGKDLGKDNNQCKAYTQITDFQICKKEGNNCIVDGINKWVRTDEKGIELGVKKGTTELSKDNWTFNWKTTGGATSTEETIKVNASLISEVTVSVEAKDTTDSTKGSTRTQIKIDNQAPKIIKVETEQGWTASKSITAEASDFNGSGILGIYIGTNTKCPNNQEDYKKVNKIENLTNAGAEYIVCAMDNVGNISSLNDETKVKIDKIGTLKETNITTDEIRNSSFTYKAELSGIKGVVDIKTDNGQATVSNIDTSGGNLYILLKNGLAKNGTEEVFHKDSPIEEDAQKSTSPGYRCPSGRGFQGRTGLTCNYKYEEPYEYSSNCLCDGSKYTSCTTPPNNYHDCEDGYSRSYSCEDKPPCDFEGKNWVDYTCTLKCTKTESATKYTITNYTCDTGKTKIESKCYSCSKGTFNSDNKKCEYKTKDAYTYYKYNISIKYVV